MTNVLAIYENFDGLQRAAVALQASGYFPDVSDKAKAITKVMAGAELGLPPFASMSGIHIINGKPVLGSNVIATLVKNDPRYDYKIKQCDDKACVLSWYEDGKPVGEAGYTIQEAQAAGLTNKDNWKKYTSDMLFARAISRGARRFAPGIFGGSPVYTPDEMGVDTDEEGYIDAQIIDVSPPPVETPKPTADEKNAPILEELGFSPKPKADFQKRPYDPETLREALKVKAATYGDYPASDKQRNFLAMLLSEFYGGDDARRHTVQQWLLGAASTKDIDGALVKAALDWMNPENNPDGSGNKVIDEVSEGELSSVYNAAIIAEGQETLI